MRTLDGLRCFHGEKSPRRRFVFKSISVFDVVAEHPYLSFLSPQVLSSLSG